MLTGDKLETAICIAKSSKLVSRTQDIHIFGVVNGRTEAHLQLNALRKKQDNALVITGNSLQVPTLCCLQIVFDDYLKDTVPVPLVKLWSISLC